MTHFHNFVFCSYEPIIQDASNGRRHEDILSNHKVGSDRRELILASDPLSSILLPYNPDSAVLNLCTIFRRILGDHELQTLHCP